MISNTCGQYILHQKRFLGMEEKFMAENKPDCC